MKEGDRIEVEIENIGHLSNVIMEAPAQTLAAAH
jgi:2-keto-4-pentenoate hydratase/2-oxohepta-3-ene-1,7-dioic acid hydratase in catechol pathway